jgi:hypothetical protein
MAVRAVIIAVENYGSIRGGNLVSKLDGTTADAVKFRDWLLQKKGVNTADIAFCANPTAAQIAAAFRDLVDNGQNATEELYVFYSGHGFSYNDNPFKQKPADFLVGSEFENLNNSGNACLKLSEIQFMLYQCLGPGTHFYFVDACRNPVSAREVNPGGLGWNRPPSQLGQPGVFTLFSAERGNFAAVCSGFAPAVVDGLGGRGRAKRRDGVEMWVSFDSLRTYLETTLAQRIATDPGPGPGRILHIDPIPTYRCTVQVKNAAGADQFTARLLNAFRVPVDQPVSFQGQRTVLQNYPDDYFVQVTHQQYELKPSDPAKIDLYDDCTVEFEKTLQAAAPPAPLAPPPPVPVSITGPPATELELTNLGTGEVVARQHDAFAGALQPGRYQVRVLESGWTALRNLRFAVGSSEGAGGEGTTTSPVGLHIDAASRDPSPLRESLLRLIPGAHDSSRVDFSEMLGPMATEDLGLWLAILGASRILGIEFSKLSALPLASFDDVEAGASPIYILAAAEGPFGVAEAGVSQPGNDRPPIQPMRKVAGIPGFYELWADGAPGAHLVFLRSAGQAASATVIYCLPNRATLLTAATSKTGELQIHQFILPIGKLKPNLTPMEQATQPANFLEAIRFTALAQKQMARLRSPAPPASSDLANDPKLVQDRMLWADLLHGKWFDPVMALMAAYELAGTSKSSDAAPLLEEALTNLRTYFSELPDVELIAKIAGLPHTEPHSLPLFLAGLHALSDPDPLMPFPAGKLEYTGPWITWVGV